nr:hypothetical protein [Halogeometricum sp. CBA1124]
MASWGVWIAVGNAASDSVDPETAAALSYLVATALAVGFVFSSGASLTVTPRGGMLAAVAGLFAGIGFVSMSLGLSRGSTTVVSGLGAMYFVVQRSSGWPRSATKSPRRESRDSRSRASASPSSLSERAGHGARPRRLRTRISGRTGT